MKIQILGTGCPKCKKTAENAEKAIKMLNVEVEVVKVQDINDIMEYGVMMTPALAIDGEVKIAGKVPSPAQIAEFIESSQNGVVSS